MPRKGSILAASACPSSGSEKQKGSASYINSTSNMGMSSLMRGQDMTSEMMERNMMGQDIYSNVLDNKNKMMSSNVVMGQNQMTPLNRMSQRMQIETMPSQSLNRFF